MRKSRSLTGIEKCIQAKKAKEMSEELSEAMMEATAMMKVKKLMGYDKKK